MWTVESRQLSSQLLLNTQTGFQQRLGKEIATCATDSRKEEVKAGGRGWTQHPAFLFISPMKQNAFTGFSNDLRRLLIKSDWWVLGFMNGWKQF